jgi:hypothetical protein
MNGLNFVLLRHVKAQGIANKRHKEKSSRPISPRSYQNATSNHIEEVFQRSIFKIGRGFDVHGVICFELSAFSAKSVARKYCHFLDWIAFGLLLHVGVVRGADPANAGVLRGVTNPITDSAGVRISWAAHI